MSAPRLTRASTRARTAKPEGDVVAIKQEPASPKATPRKRAATTSAEHTPKRVKKEEDLTSPPPDKKLQLQEQKLKQYTKHGKASPFPDFLHPTPAECKLAHDMLTRLHGRRTRPKSVVAPANRAGCGDSPSVLDALVRTILSQNTSDTNSSRAKAAMDAAYGRSDAWMAIVAGGRERLQAAIRCGGLGAVKSRVIVAILEQARERYGVYSLDHLHGAPDEEVTRELLSFQGVGPKTASCVMLFCLGRESFAVDTHVWRITGLLGWRPAKASRDETHLHLDARIPDELKYALHVLLIAHGKRCAECKAGGKNLGNCELRKAFRKGELKGEAIKEEET